MEGKLQKIHSEHNSPRIYVNLDGEIMSWLKSHIIEEVAALVIDNG